MQNKIKTKFYASPFIMIGLIIMLLLIFSIWSVVFIVFLQGGNAATTKEEMTVVFIVVTCVAMLAIITFFGVAHKGFSVIEISKSGIKKSLFKVFFKTEIKWNEMTEIRCYGMVRSWIFFSKTCLENMSYNEIIKRKDTLQIEYSRDLVELIRSFTSKEIINLPN